MQNSLNQADKPTIDRGQPITTSEYNALINDLTDPATGRPSSAKIAALPNEQKHEVVLYCTSRRAPVNAGFVTDTTRPDLLTAGYIDGYRNDYFDFWTRPEHQTHFQRIPPPPPIYSMTDEELAATADYDFTAEESEQLPPKAQPDQHPAMLQRLLNTEQALGDAATQHVVFSPPLITRHDIGIFGRGTVNVIQGPFGSHKSRLAELMAALMLTTTNETTDPQFLEFKRAMLERFCVAYVDTERNKKEELPFAVQGIKLRAGYPLDAKPQQFRFTSIKGEERKDRFTAIETFIHHVRDQTKLHLFCLIDVVTDAIGDFNDPKESMKLFDFLGNLCDNYYATFLLVIHQNPGTEKARGHTGTEAANKASTVLQIGVEKDANGNDTDLIKLRYLKLRRGRKPEPLYLQFCKETNGLQLAGADAITSHANNRKYKADVEEVADRLMSLLTEGPLPKGDVVKALESDFGVANATVRDRLKQVAEDRPLMTDEQGRSVRLSEYRDGRQQYYRLELVEQETS